MYTIISKWTPNSSIARYLSFTEIEDILASNNMVNGQPIIAPEKYNVEIFSAWALSLQEYRNYFLENPSGIDYKFFNNDQGLVITVQIFDSEQTHLAVTTQSFYDNFVAARQAFAELIDVTFEIKKTSADIGSITSFETAEILFNAL